MAKWRLNLQPEATLDGSGYVALDIYGITGAGDPIPGRHQTVQIPEDGLEAALALPTQAQVVSALKQLIRAALPVGWEDDDLEAIVQANAGAAVQAAALDSYILVDRGWTYPVDFSL